MHSTFDHASSTNIITGKWLILRIPTRHSHLPELGAAPEWLLPRAFLASGNVSGEWEFPQSYAAAIIVAGNTNGGGGNAHSNDTQQIPCASVAFPG